MSNKMNIVKGSWLIVLCLGIIILGANHAKATVMTKEAIIPLAVDDILYDGPNWETGVYTQYWLDTEMLGVLDAFCVEEWGLDATIGYELVNVEEYASELGVSRPGLGKAAIIASLYFDGTIQKLPEIKDSDEAKTSTQFAIWDTLGVLDYLTRFPDDGHYTTQVKAIIDHVDNIGYDNSHIPISIYLAESPVDGHPGGSYAPSQDYLVSVPDANIMLLLGTAFIMLSFLVRKKSCEQL